MLSLLASGPVRGQVIGWKGREPSQTTSGAWVCAAQGQSPRDYCMHHCVSA